MRRIIVSSEEKHIEIFYVKPKNVYEDKFVITGDEFHHAKNVLRKKRGDIITAVDGIGNEYVGIIDEIDYDKIVGSISKITRKPREPILDVTVIQGLIKGNRFKYFVEKSTEIGVNRIIPVWTDKSISKNLEGDKKRWENIAISAMKQSGRSVLPEIFDICSFKEGIEKVDKCDLKLIAHAECKRGMKSFENDILIETRKGRDIIKTAAIAVGPEGGFTLDEIEYAKSKNFYPINLGERRLRSETASIVALTILLFSKDDL